jgi:hypothetical protein
MSEHEGHTVTITIGRQGEHEPTGPQRWTCSCGQTGTATWPPVEEGGGAVLAEMKLPVSELPGRDIRVDYVQTVYGTEMRVYQNSGANITIPNGTWTTIGRPE